MTAPLDEILDLLGPLIEADTQNPPRQVTADGPLVAAVRAALPGFSVDVTDLGDGCLVIDCRRGQTDLLFNVHLDTVPAAKGWTHPPLTMTRLDDRAVGLGTCDTKGAAAVLFALARNTDARMHLVLTTDEEAGKSRCIRSFLETDPDARLAIVAEPTEARARLAHRGLCSVHARFAGESAHASQVDRPSAVHRAAAFITGALALPAARETRLKFGRIAGGVEANMVAAHTDLLFGFRAAPGVAHETVIDALHALDPDTEMSVRFVGPALPADSDGPAARAAASARAAADELELPIGPPVDFWTEASLFAAAGIPSLVLGAGSIAQAHNADEFVTYDQLTKVYGLYDRAVRLYG